MTEPKKRNFLLRIWLGFWRGLTAFRMAVFNILFLLVLAFVLRLLLAPGDQIQVRPDTTLVIAPKGLIVEEYSGTPAERALNEALEQQLPETRLRDILRALELAAEDDDIVQVLVNTDRLLGMAPGTLSELSAAFDDFRQSGKPVIAYGSGMNQGIYSLAALADEVWLNPDGSLLVQGYAYYRNYFAETLDKLRVDVNVFRVGEFKSAVEPFTRDSMSEADREAAEYFIGGLWQEYLDIVSGHRGMPVERLAEITETFVQRLEAAGGNSARAALEAGLVDALKARPEARAELARRGAADDNGGFRGIGLRDYLRVPRRPEPGNGRVGVIVAQGAISEGEQPPGSIGSRSLSELLRKAARDDDVEAVVLRIDSPGGGAFASEVIRQELLALKDTGKPVVVSMANVAASGGYWIAMGADEVWSYPNTITGSIGIFGLYPTFQNTLDAVGIRTDGFGVTPLAGAFRADKALPEAARRVLQATVEQGYEQFIELVSRWRDLPTERVREVAEGRVWTGAQAQERGLVDQLGTLDEAVASAARMAGIGDDYDTVYVQREFSALDRFFADMGAEALVRSGLQRTLSNAGRWPGRDLYRRLLDQFRQVARASTGRNPAEPMAHCLCEVPL